MQNKTAGQPPFSITPAILRLIADIGETLGRIAERQERSVDLRLRRVNRVRTIRGSLAIEGNTLSEEQITAILEGRRVVAPVREILEVQNAISAYAQFESWLPHDEPTLLKAHGILMAGLMENAGSYRQSGVGVMAGSRVLHVAPPAKRVPLLMNDLLNWLRRTDYHPLVSSSVFHYEFEFIHPFTDGNGRMGRLWQTLILFRWNPVFSEIPIESIVHAHQEEYYRALEDSTRATDSAPFIEFMLSMILEALPAGVTPQVERLLTVLIEEMSARDLLVALGLKDRKSFRERYLVPALQAGLVEMTLPDKPGSRFQKYRRVAGT